MNKVELIRQIRFGIEQLKSENATSDFEHICRFFSRNRIIKNVIPASGPVQAGGDQGRDFETFHSYLGRQSIVNECSLSYSESTIVFACSLEKKPLKKGGKIENDIEIILQPKLSIERIYFFSGEDIPVGLRHKKQSEVKDKYQVELEIIDANGLAEHLSDPDLFWIANQYLKIPNDFYPRRTDENWYQKLYKEYENREIQLSYEEFTDIKSALRHIYKDKELKVDINFWIEKLDLFILEDCSRDLKRKAIYEKFVTKLMGQNDISNLENIVRDYFKDLNDFANPASLEDAQVLLSFMTSSKKIIGNGFTIDELKEYANTICSLVSTELNSTDSPSKKCSFIEIQATIILHEFENMIEDYDGYLKAYIAKLEEMLPYIESAHFYPLERLTTRLLDNIKLTLELGENPKRIEVFSEKIDAFLASRYGEYKAGEKIRDRAQEYLKAGKTTVAISLLHQLKVKWFAKETLRGTVLTSLLLSDCYSRLNMEFAGKYYSMVAAHLCLVYKNENQVYDLLPQALIDTCNSCYHTGSWMNYLDLVDLTLNSYHFIKKDFDIYGDTGTSTLIFYPAIIKLMAEKFNLSIINYIDNKFSKLGYIDTEIKELYDKIKEENNPMFEKAKASEILSDQIVGTPFNDIGKYREIIFKAFGTKWSIRFPNDYITNSIAEQFVAMVQIFLVELVDQELYLLKSNVIVELKKSTTDLPRFEPKPSNTETIWHAEIPFYSGSQIDVIDKFETFYSALVGAILRNISLLPDEKFKEVLIGKFNEGLFNKITFGNSYNYHFRYFIDESVFKESKRDLFENYNIAFDYNISDNKELPWNNTSAPAYSKTESLKYIKNRLNFKAPLELSITKWKENEVFMTTVFELRKTWCDWHIYLALVNLVINYKLSQIGIRLTQVNRHNFPKIFFEYSQKKETEWPIEIPMEIIDKTSLEKYMRSSGVLSVLPSFGLQNFSETPNFDAILDLLSVRFNFLKDGKELTCF